MRRWWRIARPRRLAAGPVPVPYVPYDVNHVLGTGQSLAVGATSTAESTTQPYDNLMLAGGVQATSSFSSQFLDLVESGVETMSSGMANLVTELAAAKSPSIAHAMLVSVHGAGGTPYSGLKKGTTFYTRGMDQVDGAKSRAATNGSSYIVRVVTSVHGESDAIAGSTTYQADMVEWQADYENDVKAITGQTASIPMLHTQPSSGAGWRIPKDMLAAHVANPGKIVLVGPKYHLPLSDGVHLTTAGYKHMGEDYAKVYKRIVLDGLPWEPLRPISLVRVGAVITVKFLVPAPPLTIDTDLVASAPGWGFVWSTNGAGTSSDGPAVTDIEVTSADTVRLTLASNPGGPGYLRYAYWDQIGFDGPRGNLRDSDGTISRFGFPLFNWCVQFEEAVN